MAKQMYGLEVAVGTLRELMMPGERFDFAYMFHVLEHVLDPLDLIVEVRRLLRGGGVLFLRAPNPSSAWAHLAGPYWPLFSPRQHIWHFTSEAMKALMERAEMEVLSLTGGLAAVNVNVLCRKPSGPSAEPSVACLG
jgi:2-polyprenyl-3-methyl-5-hydroxy-6-metoxy-1,4-benzoquinol methylase